MLEDLKYPDRINEDYEGENDDGAEVSENNVDGGRDLEDKTPKKAIVNISASNSEVIISIYN